MNARTNRWVIAAGIDGLILGVILSRVIEPGIRVGKTMLTTNTPALRLFPATPGPHPIALLAHGNGGSKKMLFRFGEALAAFLFATLMCALGISTLLLLPSTLVGRIAARGGSRRDGDVAVAIFASYVIGQIMPFFY